MLESLDEADWNALILDVLNDAEWFSEARALLPEATRSSLDQLAFLVSQMASTKSEATHGAISTCCAALARRLHRAEELKRAVLMNRSGGTRTAKQGRCSETSAGRWIISKRSAWRLRSWVGVFAVLVLARYGVAQGPACDHGDLDLDGDVGLADLAARLAVYGTTCAQPGGGRLRPANRTTGHAWQRHHEWQVVDTECKTRQVPEQASCAYWPMIPRNG